MCLSDKLFFYQLRRGIYYLRKRYIAKHISMKKATLTILALILIQVLAMAQHTGGIGRGDYSLSSTNPVVVTATSGTTGPTGYQTLKAAFDAINLGTHHGEITVKINGSTTETLSAVLYQSGYIPSPGKSIGSTYTLVNIYPTATGISISGNLDAPLVDLNGADNVTFDGRINMTGSADLTISNISASSTTGTSTIRFINDASDNLVKYCKIKGSSTDAAAGIVFFSTADVDAGSGNDANIIDNNDITCAADADRPLNAIYSFGTSESENSDITISNNNIYDFLNPGSHSRGIYLRSNTTSCTISGNSLYEMAPFVPTAYAVHQLIFVYNEGNNFTVSGNHIGGNSTNCSGTWTKAIESSDDNFTAIRMIVGNGAESNIQGNAIKNFSWSNAGSKGSGWNGISVLSGNVNVGTAAANIIGGSTGTGSITYYCGAGKGRLIGISLSEVGTKNVENNRIGSIAMAGTDPTQGHVFFGILNDCTGITTIRDNTIGSETTAGSINLSSPSTVGEQQVLGINNEGTGSVTISGNLIANMTNGTTNSDPGAPGLIHGITTWDGSNTISGNIVRDLTITNANNAEDFSASVIGIALNCTTAVVQSITGNTIYNLSNANASFDGNVIGLYYNGSTTASMVSKNFIHSLSVNASITTSANIYGIKIENGATTWSNNIISLGSNTSANIYGIYERGDEGNDNSLYYNTVYIGGVSVLYPMSYALYSAASTNTRNFRNNIFDNARRYSQKVPGGRLYLNYAVWFNYGVSDNLTLDNNDYYAPGLRGVLGHYQSKDVISLPMITGMDANSKSVDPGFASAGGTSAANYLPSAAVLVAATGTGITIDYGGNPRKATYPAMGAWEYNVTPPCANPTSGGTIAAGQAICSGMQPAELTSLTLPEGYTGTLEYKWQYSIISASSGFADIGTATGIIYAPGTLTQTTWFKRVARVTCKGDWTGAAESNVLTITVYTLPTATMAGTTAVCRDVTAPVITFTGANGTEPYRFAYTLNSGSAQTVTTTTGNSVTLPQTTATPGTFIYTLLSVTDAHDCNQSQAGTVIITVNPIPTVDAVNPQVLCNGSTTTAVAFTGAVAGTVYSWTNDNTGIGLMAQGTGDISGFTATNPGASPLVATIVVTPTFTNGSLSCTGPSKSFTITVNPLLPVGVSIEASANSRCNGTVIGYTATPVNAGINPLYQWKVNGNNVGTNNPLYVYIPIDGDVVNCVLTVVNPEACFVGGTAISNAIHMTVYPYLEVGVSIASSASQVCAGAPVTFTATPVNGGNSPSYQWMVNGINAGSNNQVFTFVPANGDQVSCKMTSNEQCVLANPATSNTLTMAVTPLLPVSVSISASANPVCTGTQVSFTATPINGGSNPEYQWKVNALNVGANNPVYAYVPSNGDVITCVLTANEVCMSGNPATSNAITLTVNPLPVPVLTGLVTVISGTTGVVYTTQTGQLNYTWNISPGGTITAGGTTADPTATVTWNTAGAQWISVNYTNPQTGCSGAAATQLNVTVTQASFIAITSPSGGEEWRLGSVHNITWNDNIAGDVTIELFKDGAYQQTIAAATPSTGTFEWTIASNQQPGAGYKVKITSMADPALYGMSSSVFTISYDLPINLEVRDIPIADGVNICFDALQTITVAGTGHTFVVQPGGSATFIAGQNILYLPGTTVQPGGYMHGYITQTAEYCWSLPPSFVSTSVSPKIDTSPASVVPRPVSRVPIPVSRVPIPASAWFRVYPNPTDGKFMVEYIGKDQPGTITVEVFGMKGERILTSEMTDVRKQEFSLEGRANGIYLVRIVAEEATKTVRVLKR